MLVTRRREASQKMTGTARGPACRAWVWQDSGRAADRRREGLMRRRKGPGTALRSHATSRNTTGSKCSPISAPSGRRSATERLSTSTSNSTPQT